MDFYAEAGQHETIHHDERVKSIGHHDLEEHATRMLDRELRDMGYDRRSVSYTSVRRITPNYII